MSIVAAVYTASAIVQPISEIFERKFPSHRLINIVDDGLIQDIIAGGGVSVATARRLLHCYMAGVDSGADVILNTCSSVGEVVAHAQSFVPIPIVRIDRPMVEAAVETGSSIAVLATLPTTLGPTVGLVKDVAREVGKEIGIVEGLADGAFQALISGDPKTHDKLIIQVARNAANDADVIVLAQGSMARMRDALADATGIQVYASPDSGIAALREYLDQSQ
jgi:Asp/Glu/hydantoin racemase